MSTNSSNLALGLDSRPAARVWQAWTMQIGSRTFSFSTAEVSSEGFILLRNAFMGGTNVPAVGSTVTVKLLGAADPGIVVPTTTVSTDEGGSTAEVMVSLATAPTATVTLALSSSDEGEATVSPSSLEFTSADWNTNQPFTITGQDDDVVDGEQAYTITVAATSDDGAYGTLTAEIAGVNGDDGDEAGLVLSPTRVSTDESGVAAEVTVSLMSEPTGPVTLTITSSDPGEAAASPGSLEFTADNWDTGQTITVTGEDDGVEDGLRGYTITVDATSADSGYDGRAETIFGTNADNGARLRPASGTEVWSAELRVGEFPGSSSADEGFCGSCRIVGPSFGSLSDDDFEFSGDAYTVEALLWNPNNGRVEIEMDSLPSSTVRNTWILGIGARTFPLSGFGGHPSDSAALRSGLRTYLPADQPALNSTVIVRLVAPPATPGILLSETGVETDEGGRAATATVFLASAPTGTVTVTVTSSDTDEATVSPPTLTFTSADWDDGKAVTVTGVDDGAGDGDQGYVITASVAAAPGDSNYIGVSATMAGTNADDDEPVAPGIVLPETVSPEEGGSVEVPVSLRTEPSGTVTLFAVSSDEDEATVSPSALTFGPGDWNTDQIFTVTGVDDDVAGANPGYTITVVAFSIGDSSYNLTVEVSGAKTDNDTAGIVLLPTSVATDEGGLTAEVMVSLMSEPTAQVVLTVTSSDEGEATASPSTLTFGPGSGARAWNMEQTLTVTGADDIVDDGDQNYVIAVSVASSADSVYAGLPPEEIAGVNADDDEPLPPPADETVVWSAELTVENNPRGNDRGFCAAACQTSFFNGVFGSLSDNSFDLEGTAYTVEGIVWGITGGSDDLFFDLNRLPAMAVYQTLTLQIGSRRFGLSGSNVTTNTAASRSHFEIMNVYGSARQGPAAGSTVTVRLLGPPPAADPGIVLPEPNVPTAEGGTVEVPVLLATEPSGTVTLTITSSDEGEATVFPPALTFTPADWNVTQTFTVTGEENDVVGPNPDYTITVSSTSSEDSDYNSLDPVEASGSKADNDMAGIELSRTTVTTVEPSIDPSVTLPLDVQITWRIPVSLMSEPTAQVVLTLSSSDEGEATVSPAELTFGPGSGSRAWNRPQTITVAGQDDNVDDEGQPFTIRVEASSADPLYAPLTAEISGVNGDDDVSGFVGVIQSGGSAGTVSTSESGGSAVVEVFLRSEPTATVTLSLVSAGLEGDRLVGSDEASVEPAQLTFTPANWRMPPQQFTVTGRDDNVVDGDQNYVIAIASASDDGNYRIAPLSVLAGVNVDDDTAGIFLRAPPGAVRLSTDEGGRMALVMVSLNSEPTSAVTLSISSDDPTEATASPASLEFMPGNWDTVQVFTVTGEDDGIEDGRQSYAIMVQAFSDDGDYNNVSAVVRGDNADDDMAAILLRGNVLTGEDGTEATVTVSLATEPMEAVTLTITSSNPREAGVGPVELTFTPADWNTGQTFRVAGITDAVADGNQAYTITVSVSSSGDDYEGLSAEIAGENVDDDEAGLMLSPTTVSTDEGGGTDTVEVSLMSEPTRAVTLRIASSDTGEARVSPTALTFGTGTGAGGWNTPQTFTVAGRNDDVDDGDRNYTITVTPGSRDGVYNSLPPEEISGVNVDDDMAGFILDPADGGSLGTIAEDGGRARFTAVLGSRPAAGTGVVLGVASSSADRAGVSRAALTFTSSNWDRPQTVTVRGVANDSSDGDATVAVTVSVDAATTDPGYTAAGLASQTLSVLVEDDNSPGFSLGGFSGSGLGTIAEGGRTARFTAVLRSEPSGTVVLGAAPSTARVTLSPVALTFDSSNWESAQTVTVTGVDNDIADGNATVEVTVSVDGATTDTDYRTTVTTAQSLSVLVEDDDEAGIVVPGGRVSTNEGGGTDTVAVSLRSEPTAQVVLTVTSSDTGEATVSPPTLTLTFAPADWDTAQTFTVTGVDDDVDDDDQSYAITVMASGGDYEGRTARISGVNVDDDDAGIVVSPTSVSTAESGSTVTVMVSLATMPTAAVTLTLTSLDPGEATVSPPALTFAPAVWDTNQTFMVTGVNDDLADGDRPYEITVEASGGDYEGRAARISGVNADNDIDLFALSPEGALSVLPGETATLSVSLVPDPGPGISVGALTLTVTHDAGGSAVTLTPTTMVELSGVGDSETIEVSIAEDASEEVFPFMVTISPVTPATVMGTVAGTTTTYEVASRILTVSLARRGQPAMEAVQGALAVLDGAGGAQLAADLIAGRARPGADEPRTVLGGADLLSGVDREALSADREAEQEGDPFGDRADFEARRPDVVRTLAGSGFSRNLGDSGAGGLSVWGAGAAVDIEIRVDGHETEYDGNVFGAQIGVEMQAGAGVAVGVAVGASQGELKARNSDLRRIEQDMLSLHPYLAWNAGDFSGWLVAGFGAGDYTVETVDGDRASADASTAMLGAGVDTRWEAGGFDLALRGSAVGSRSELDEALDLPRETNDVPDGTKSEFWRLRAELEAGRTFAGAGGAVFRPYATAGGRQDGGDGPTGGAGELGLGLRLGLDRSLTADLSARVQVTDADLEEKSLSGSLRYDHGADGRGLLLSAGSDRRYVEGDAGTAVHRGRIGYGWAGSVLRRTARSELYMSGARGDGSRGPRLGAEFDAAPLSLGISGGRGEMRLEMDYRF